MTDNTPSEAAMAPELLPCPFCGGEANADGHTKYSRPLADTRWADGTNITETFFVNCMPCGARSRGGLCDGYQTRAEAITAWNTRAVRHLPAAEPVGVSACNQCGAEYPRAPAGTIHKCGRCSGGYCSPIAPPDKVNSEALADLIAGDADLIDAGLVGYSQEPTTPRHSLSAIPTHAVNAELVEAVDRTISFLNDLGRADLDELAADGGVTVGMVFQQQARWEATKLQRAALTRAKGDGA